MNWRRSTTEVFEELFRRTEELESCREEIAAGFDLLHDCYAGGHKLLTCGNGGSAADSEHIVGELMKSFARRRPITAEDRARLSEYLPEVHAEIADRLERALPAISLVSHTSLATAVANDVGADMVFAQQVYGYGRPGDLLIAISTSGRSRNAVNAARVAGAFGLTSIALTGEAASPLSELCAVAIRVPARETAFVQEYHLKVYHALCAMIEAELFDEGE